MHEIEQPKITALLFELLQPKSPPVEFEEQLRIKLKGEFQKRQEEKANSQIDMAKIQRIIGMAVTNEHFRRSLFENVDSACRNAGFNLSELELAALKNLKADAVIDFAGELDERISKQSVFPSS